MNYKAICLICSFFAANSALAAPALKLCGDIKQGELLVFKDLSSEIKSIWLKNKEYPVTNDGFAIVALHRDTAKTVEICTSFPHDASDCYKLSVAPAQWDIQKVNGVAQSKVTPGKNDEAEILREQKDVGRSLTIMQPGKYWQKGFILPVEGRISGNFGNQRIFNGIPKSPHSGTDIAAPEGTPVKASADGKVVLSGKNYFYTGNMVIIDHGEGLQTIYAHLKEAKVQEGDMVKQGDIIGLVGHTGRATGPHLHWGASLNNVRFRPHSLLDLNNKECHIVNGQYMGE